jgi:hypothetical protein
MPRIFRLLDQKMTKGSREQTHTVMGQEVKPTAHAIVASFPKCGTTWLRMLLARVFELHLGLPGVPLVQLAGEKPHPRVPRILYAHENLPQWKKPGELAQDKSSYKNESILFLCRDPRDVLVSNYLQKTHRAKFHPESPRSIIEANQADRLKPFNGTIDEFIQQDIGGFASIIAYFNIWHASRNVPKKFLLLRYEDLSRDTKGALQQVVRFLGLSGVGDTTLQSAIEFASFENMRAMEATNSASVDFLRPADVNDSESYKIRRGKVGGFVDYLSSAQIEALTKQMQETLNPELGYST